MHSCDYRRTPPHPTIGWNGGVLTNFLPGLASNHNYPKNLGFTDVSHHAFLFLKKNNSPWCQWWFYYFSLWFFLLVYITTKEFHFDTCTQTYEVLWSNLPRYSFSFSSPHIKQFKWVSLFCFSCTSSSLSYFPYTLSFHPLPSHWLLPPTSPCFTLVSFTFCGSRFYGISFHTRHLVHIL
jgi:hypothetical protein